MSNNWLPGNRWEREVSSSVASTNSVVVLYSSSSTPVDEGDSVVFSLPSSVTRQIQMTGVFGHDSALVKPELGWDNLG